MVKRKTDIWDIIVNTIIIVAFVIAVYWFFQLLFGGSPDLSEFNSLLIIMIVGVLFNLYREIGEIKVGMKYSFEKIRDDISLIKEDVGLIKKKLKV